MHHVLPDYDGHGLCNLMQSLATACGAADTSPTLPVATCAALAPNILSQARNLLLIVIDGLGDDYLLEHFGDGLLARLRIGRLSSVFPSTTATAVTSYLTGLAPAQHAMTGWHMHYPELGAGSVTAVLPLHARAGTPEVALEPEALFDSVSLFDRIERPGYAVAPADIVDSAFNRHHCGRAQRVGYVGLEAMFDTLRTLVGVPGPKFVHAYYPELDSLAHRHGVASRKVADACATLEHALDRFLADIATSGTRVLISADHGFIDAPPERVISLDEHPTAAAMLRNPLCGERRASYAYIRPGAEAAFEDYVRQAWHGVVDLYRSTDLVARGWFGPLPPNPRLLGHIGDYTLIPREDWTLVDWLPGERRYRLVGVHGGTSSAEMFVPLLCAEC